MMVVGTKMAIQQVPSKRRLNIVKLKSCSSYRRRSLCRILYGGLCIMMAVLLILLKPIERIANSILDMREGTVIYNTWENPTYQVFTQVWVYNYTNVQEYLDGNAKQLELDEIGPYVYREIRKNKNLTVDKERGVVKMRPDIKLEFNEARSVARTEGVQIYVPNIAVVIQYNVKFANAKFMDGVRNNTGISDYVGFLGLIGKFVFAISTLIADRVGYLANVGAYYSISAMGSKLFKTLTVEEYLWGYYDPIVTIASNVLPGWIDFGKIGLMDRLYAPKDVEIELEIKDESKKYSINKWDDSFGIREQGYTDLNTSIPCNLIKGSYEGLMVSPNLQKNKELKIYRAQACRVYPFEFESDETGGYGFVFYRYKMAKSAFSRNSTYDCKCEKNCLPEGFVDIGSCFYGFPIVLSKPHFLDADLQQLSYFKGMHPDPEKHSSTLELEPTYGIPMSLSSKIQVNIAVRTSPGNPITMPLDNKMVPLIWVNMYCEEAPSYVITILQIRLVFAPALLIAIEVLLFITGFIFGFQGCYWYIKKSNDFEIDYPKVINNNNVNFSIHDQNVDVDTLKESISLLNIDEETNLRHSVSYSCLEVGDRNLRYQ